MSDLAVEKTIAEKAHFANKAQSLVKRAQAHGVQLVPGEPFIITIEKLVDRLDAYRDRPNTSGKILIE